MVVDAAIVKLMKARKAMDVGDLVLEALVMVRSFKPEPEHVSRRVESLVEREFLRREKESV
jgi:hypothetical protein